MGLFGKGQADAEAHRPAEGEPAPDFDAKVHPDGSARLADFKGTKPFVLYFYPKDSTPGCTVEACGFRDASPRFEAAGLEVLGASTDTVESHAKFAAAQKLPFRLLADPDATLARAYGVVSPKGYAERVSFLVDRAGIVRKVYPKVSPLTHADEILRDAAALGILTGTRPGSR